MIERENSASKREKLLIGILIGMLILALYFFIRGKALDLNVLVLEDQIKQVQKKVTKQKKRGDIKIEIPELDGRKISPKDIKKLQEKLAAEKALMSGSNHVFIDLRNNNGLPELLGAITRLAEGNSLIVTNKRQHDGDLLELLLSGQKQDKQNKHIQFAIDPTDKKAVLASNELRRPLYDLTMKGGFVSLVKFIEDLGKLDYSVILTRVRINTTEMIALSGGRQLNIEITLAL